MNQCNGTKKHHRKTYHSFSYLGSMRKSLSRSIISLQQSTLLSVCIGGCKSASPWYFSFPELKSHFVTDVTLSPQWSELSDIWFLFLADFLFWLRRNGFFIISIRIRQKIHHILAKLFLQENEAKRTLDDNILSAFGNKLEIALENSWI